MKDQLLVTSFEKRELKHKLQTRNIINRSKQRTPPNISLNYH